MVVCHFIVHLAYARVVAAYVRGKYCTQQVLHVCVFVMLVWYMYADAPVSILADFFCNAQVTNSHQNLSNSLTLCKSWDYFINPNPLGCVQYRIQIGGFGTVKVKNT